MQTELDFKTHGGRRAGAGRKRKPRHDVEHRARPTHKQRHPVHATLRVLKTVGRLRRRRVLDQLRKSLLVVARRELTFRIVHLSIQRNHLHLLVEAEDNTALSRGMQAFAISAARAINRAQRRKGQVFAFRYHSVEIQNRRQTRHALAYVLNNWRHHRVDGARSTAVDEYSTGVLFDGWTRGPFAIPRGHVPLTVRPARTWLLRVGWRMYGAIDPREVPS